MTNLTNQHTAKQVQFFGVEIDQLGAEIISPPRQRWGSRYRNPEMVQGLDLSCLAFCLEGSGRCSWVSHLPSSGTSSQFRSHEHHPTQRRASIKSLEKHSAAAGTTPTIRIRLRCCWRPGSIFYTSAADERKHMRRSASENDFAEATEREAEINSADSSHR